MDATEHVDNDIDKLNTRISSLQAQRANLGCILLSQPNLSARFSTASEQANLVKIAQQAIKQQRKRNVDNMYRACAGVTAYRVQDPDPMAVNNGNILGISIDVALDAKFVETYHVLLNWRSSDEQKTLWIHKHTVPACIPLQQLMTKWLPPRGNDTGAVFVQEQDLIKFGKALRKELVSWHLRTRILSELRKEAALTKNTTASPLVNTFDPTYKALNVSVDIDGDDDNDDDDDDGVKSSSESEAEQQGAYQILDIEADHAVRQITVKISRARSAVMTITKDGEIERAVCATSRGDRDMRLGRRIIGPLKGLVTRLQAQK